MFTIDTLVGHERMSTQDLLLAIGQAVAQGETNLKYTLLVNMILVVHYGIQKEKRYFSD